MSEHTPGPWTAKRDRTAAWSAIGYEWVIPDAYAIVGGGNELDPSEVEANARLIAAAPATYQANVLSVGVLEEVWDALMDDRLPDVEMLNDALAANRAAISKAEGRETP